MNYYRIDYFSRRIGAYTYKVIKANTPEEAARKSRIKNVEGVTLVSTEKFNYLSQCRDYELLLNHYPEEQLEDFETAIREYEESGCTEDGYEVQAYYGFSDIINWYEGAMDTEELFDFVEVSEKR